MYSLPALPYGYSDLEPHIDGKTMEIHHTKHHQAYIDNLNAAFATHPELANKSLTDILKNLSELPAEIQTAVRNNGGGHYNHSLFWELLSPNGSSQPTGKLKDAIISKWGELSKFQEEFMQAAKTRFGSGWAWLCKNSNGELSIISTANQDTPLAEGLMPVLGLDVWEHAYYLNYQNRRPDYVSSWWNIVNWNKAEELFTA